MFDLLVIMGRGIRRQRSDVWIPAPDFVELDEEDKNIVNHAGLPDESPNCFIGGSELNLLAGLELCRKYPFKLAVCAFGGQPYYLKQVDGPTESEIMSQELCRLAAESNVSLPTLEIWTKDLPDKVPANTSRELENIFELALKKELARLAIVTVTVHFPRTIVFARHHLSRPAFKDLRAHFFASEQVLLMADASIYLNRIQRVYNSLAFQRNAGLESLGLTAFLEGRYELKY